MGATHQLDDQVRRPRGPFGGADSASRTYLLIWGLTLVALGIGSLIIHPNFSVGDGIDAKKLFGALETNGWHGVAGLGSGLVSLVGYRVRRRAPLWAIGVGLMSGLVPGAVFLAVGDGRVAGGLIPVDVADAVLLHLVPGAIGVACATVDWMRA